MRIYLDSAATSILDPQVAEVMSNAMLELHGNPSSIHKEGRQVRNAIEEARRSIARHLNASTAEIFFTSGGTESNNMILKGAVRDLGVRRIISSPLEHHCVGHTLEALAANEHIRVEMVDIDARGVVDYQDLEKRLQDTTEKTLVSLMHANNEIGTMLDIERVGDLCRSYGVYFHSDTVQTVGKFDFDLQKLPVHFISGAAHKFHGPKGIGFVYISGDVTLKPFIDGGAQERNMRGGTENIYGIIGMAKALDLAYQNKSSRKAYILELRQYFKEQLIQYIGDVQFNGVQEGDFLYTVLNISFPASDKSSLLLLQLDIAGISASGGSACSSGAEKGSHVLEAIGADPKRKSIRFSLSGLNTKEEIDIVVQKLAKILEVPVRELV